VLDFTNKLESRWIQNDTCNTKKTYFKPKQADNEYMNIYMSPVNGRSIDDNGWHILTMLIKSIVWLASENSA